jgi:hypothetical protein|tara:strand:- start:1195 stop:1377 length:183 start_codon:yes stop_codon:yes gene_type:complete
MITVSQILDFANLNRDAFSEVIKLAGNKEDDILLQLLEEKTQEIVTLRKQISLLTIELNS